MLALNDYVAPYDLRVNGKDFFSAFEFRDHHCGLFATLDRKELLRVCEVVEAHLSNDALNTEAKRINFTLNLFLIVLSALSYPATLTPPPVASRNGVSETVATNAARKERVA